MTPKQFGNIKKLHTLLKVAIGDFEKVLADKKHYVIDMDHWHTKEPGKKCVVCMAGSVMAHTLGVSPLQNITYPEHLKIDRDIGDRLYAINSLRSGLILEALNDMDRDYHSKLTVHKMEAVMDLDSEWNGEIPYSVRAAHDRRSGKVLLKYMKKLHADLEKLDV